MYVMPVIILPLFLNAHRGYEYSDSETTQVFILENRRVHLYIRCLGFQKKHSSRLFKLDHRFQIYWPLNVTYLHCAISQMRHASTHTQVCRCEAKPG